MPIFMMIDGAAKIANTDHGTTNGGTYQFGAAASDRIIVACLSVQAGAGASINSMTIGGVAATLQVTAGTGGAGAPFTQIWTAAVPSGTSGAISIATSGTISAIGFSVYSMTGARSQTPSNTLSTTLTSSNVTVPASGAIIAASTNVVAGGATFSWTNLTKDTDFAISASGEDTTASGQGYVSPQTIMITATPTSTAAHSLVAASWGP